MTDNIHYSKEQVQKETKNIKWNNNESVSDFYNRHQIFLEDLTNADNISSQLFFIEIKISYINVLISKNRYSLSKPILSDIDIILGKVKDHEDYQKLYEKYLTISGIVEGRLENYESSLQIFKELREIDPNNDLYKKWYVFNKSNLNTNNIRILTYIGFAIVMIDILADLLFDYELNKTILIVGFTLLLIGFLAPYAQKYFTKIKEKI